MTKLQINFALSHICLLHDTLALSHRVLRSSNLNVTGMLNIFREHSRTLRPHVEVCGSPGGPGGPNLSVANISANKHVSPRHVVELCTNG